MTSLFWKEERKFWFELSKLLSLSSSIIEQAINNSDSVASIVYLEQPNKWLMLNILVEYHGKVVNHAVSEANRSGKFNEIQCATIMPNSFNIITAILNKIDYKWITTAELLIRRWFKVLKAFIRVWQTNPFLPAVITIVLIQTLAACGKVNEPNTGQRINSIVFWQLLGFTLDCDYLCRILKSKNKSDHWALKSTAKTNHQWVTTNDIRVFSQFT